MGLLQDAQFPRAVEPEEDTRYQPCSHQQKQLVDKKMLRVWFCFVFCGAVLLILSPRGMQPTHCSQEQGERRALFLLGAVLLVQCRCPAEGPRGHLQTKRKWGTPDFGYKPFHSFLTNVETHYPPFLGVTLLHPCCAPQSGSGTTRRDE